MWPNSPKTWRRSRLHMSPYYKSIPTQYVTYFLITPSILHFYALLVPAAIPSTRRENIRQREDYTTHTISIACQSSDICLYYEILSLPSRTALVLPCLLVHWSGVIVRVNLRPHLSILWSSNASWKYCRRQYTPLVVASFVVRVCCSSQPLLCRVVHFSSPFSRPHVHA